MSGSCWLGYSQTPRSVSVATRPAERKHKLMEGEEDARLWLLVLLLLLGEWSVDKVEHGALRLFASFISLGFTPPDIAVGVAACMVLGTCWADSDLPALLRSTTRFRSL
jgi:hypothetical protein